MKNFNSLLWTIVVLITLFNILIMAALKDLVGFSWVDVAGPGFGFLGLVGFCGAMRLARKWC